MSENNKKFYLSFIPGYVQGFTRVCIAYPFDTIKVYMQKGIYMNASSAFNNIIKKDPRIFYRGSSLSFLFVPVDRSLQFHFAEKLNKKYSPIITGCIIGSITPFYSVPLQYLTTNAVLTDKTKYRNLSNFIKNTDFKKLYKGFPMEYIRSNIGVTTYFSTYMFLRNHIDIKNQVYTAPLFGTIANVFSWICMFPLDTLRTEKQTTNLKYMEIIKNRIGKNGLKSFYRGITPVLLRTVPSASIGMWSYEYTKKILLL